MGQFQVRGYLHLSPSC